MAKKLTDASIPFLSEAEITAEDIWYIVNDPSGTPASRKGTLAYSSSKFYKISPTISSNNLTVAVQHLDGSAPSSSKPLVFKIADSWKVVTSSLTYTKNAATNWHGAGGAELAGKDIDYFVYAINETGASAGLKIGHSRLPWAVTMGDFVNTTTSEKYIAGSWTNFNSTDQVQLIGRFRAQLSAAASYNWSIPNSKVINHPIFQTDWLTWTPQWTNLTAGNGTIAAFYQIGQRILKGNLRISFGSTTAITGSGITYTIPFSNINISTFHPVGHVSIHDAGAVIYIGQTEFETTTSFRPIVFAVSGSFIIFSQISSTSPMTWVTTDELMSDFIYPI